MRGLSSSDAAVKWSPKRGTRMLPTVHQDVEAFQKRWSGRVLDRSVVQRECRGGNIELLFSGASRVSATSITLH